MSLSPSSETAPIGVIAGSGLYELFGSDAPTRRVPTPYGATSGPLTTGSLGGREVVFLARHGSSHSVPPHRINYRANIWALKRLGARSVVTFSAVGGLRREYAPGQFVLTDQFIDRTHGRDSTFFDGEVLAASGVQHLSAAYPFSPELRDAAGQALHALGEDFHTTGTVVVIQGPRFSTAAESRWFRSIGGDIVNMTQYPEAVLAAELGMGSVNLSFVTDSDAGVMDDESSGPASGEVVAHQTVLRRLADAQPRIKAALAAIVGAVDPAYEAASGIDPKAIQAVLDQPVRES